eukprot:CAMPEP_0196654644 /NCGR_PEP_ID=MMETSP1086-20130531/4372_1 /TAXON_ID=77921 /ORGANISM="Cyanoptyche  gloeocystis , Strain SAG4.97" /LENGTH=173 /DNA_ID=CAMNT_0041986531 /DNA_START=22 /DNA_END=540 /DNA_ORIENTATION=+
MSFVASPVSPTRISGCSWRPDGPVTISDLRYLTLSYKDMQGNPQVGELVVHESVASEVTEIFRELYEKGFPIEKMRLIDDYDADDDLSMADNNTSALCVRPLTGGKKEWSNHAYGLAIDINPRLNPYVKGSVIHPENGAQYANRSNKVPGMIFKGDDCYNAFVRRGWEWGGDW